MKTQIDRVFLPMSEQISRRKISRFTLRQKGLRCCLTTTLSIPPPLKPQWMEAVGVSNNHILKSKTVASWKTTGCELILLQYFPLLHINRIQVMHGNKCNKEGIRQVLKTVEDQTFLFWQGDKRDPKNIWKTNRRTETENKGTQKRTWISNRTMQILATEHYGSKRISGLRKQDEISMVIRTTMLIVKLMNILCFLITIYSVMDYC